MCKKLVSGPILLFTRIFLLDLMDMWYVLTWNMWVYNVYRIYIYMGVYCVYIYINNIIYIYIHMMCTVLFMTTMSSTRCDQQMVEPLGAWSLPSSVYVRMLGVSLWESNHSSWRWTRSWNSCQDGQTSSFNSNTMQYPSENIVQKIWIQCSPCFTTWEVKRSPLRALEFRGQTPELEHCMVHQWSISDHLTNEKVISENHVNSNFNQVAIYSSGFSSLASLTSPRERRRASSEPT